MRQSSESLEDRVWALETRVNVLELLLAERYPATPAPSAVEPSSKKKTSEALLRIEKLIYLKNPDEPKSEINEEFAMRIIDFDKHNVYTSDPNGADVALYFMFVSGGRPDLTAVRRVIEKDNFPTRAMIFLCPGNKQPFVASDNLLPDTKVFFFLLYDDLAMKKFEEKGSKRRTEQDTVLRNAIDYLTK